MILSRAQLVWMFFVLLLITPRVNAEDPAPEAEEATSAEAVTEEEKAEGEGEEEKKDEEKEFAEVVEDFERIEGLFSLYRNPEDNKVFLEIGPDQFDRVFLCAIAREAGDGLFYDSGTMLGSFPFVFERVGKKVRFVHKNVSFRADEDAPIAGAVARGLSSSLVGSSMIEGKPHPERNSVLVDPTPFFIKDHTGVVAGLKSRNDKLDYSFDAEESFFASLKSFPENTEIETVAHFTSSKPRATSHRIADSRSMEHRYRYSLIEIPESDYMPRLADDRTGYFLTMFQDYTTLTKETPYTWYVERWNLQKKNPGASLSEPKEPIVFWLENTIPHEYRDAIREGALLWNTAFEKVGFKNAVVVKQQEADAEWDPSDIRYNTIRWIVMPGGGYAVGPSLANPFTGEIYAADIRISADFIRYFFRSYEEYVNPLSTLAEGPYPEALGPGEVFACRHAQGKAHEAAFGIDLMNARQYVDPDSPEFQEFVHDGLVDLVAHEVGHTLGLRHNYRGSTIHTLDELHNTDLTNKEGVSGSVMDYNPVNLASKDRKQGSYWCTNLGVYDYWVIEYGYKPIDAKTPEGERKELDKIASRSTEPKLAYATDEDAFGYSFQGVDPVTNLWDYGPDPIAFFEERCDLTDEVMNNIEQTFSKPGARYQKMRLVFERGIRQYSYAGRTVAKYLGGLYHHRDHIDAPGGREPFVPVSAKDQRRALDFLNTRIFGRDAFAFSPSLVNKLAPERLYDFDWSLYFVPRVDFPVHDRVLAIQKAALQRLYHPITLNRMVDFPLHRNGDPDIVTMHEMFEELSSTIWAEAHEGRNVDSFRRNLQRAHLDKLVSLVVKPVSAPYRSAASGSDPAGHIPPPEDARSFARANLVALGEAIGSALESGGLDPETLAHLDESNARIQAALEAGVQRGI